MVGIVKILNMCVKLYAVRLGFKTPLSGSIEKPQEIVVLIRNFCMKMFERMLAFQWNCRCFELMQKK